MSVVASGPRQSLSDFLQRRSLTDARSSIFHSFNRRQSRAGAPHRLSPKCGAGRLYTGSGAVVISSLQGMPWLLVQSGFGRRLGILQTHQRSITHQYANNGNYPASPKPLSGYAAQELLQLAAMSCSC